MDSKDLQLICPLNKIECLEEACAWYSEDCSSCAVLLLAETMQDASMEGGAIRTADYDTWIAMDGGLDG